MFNKPILNTPFCIGEASNIFNEVVKENRNSHFDDSFVTTLRALLYERLSKRNESVKIRTFYVTLSPKDAATVMHWHKIERASEYFLGSVYPLSDANHNIIVSQFFNLATFEKLDELFGIFPEFFGDATRLKDVEVYFKQRFNFQLRVYTNEAVHAAYIFTSKKVPLQIYHVLQAFIPRYLPWLFEDSPISDREQALLKSLTERYEPKYLNLINEIYDGIDIKQIVLERNLRGFNGTFTKDSLRDVKNRISNVERRIEDYIAQLANYREQIHALNATKIGLETELSVGTDAADQALIDYFSTNNAVNFVRARDGVLEFYVCSTIETYQLNSYHDIKDWATSWYNVDCLPPSSKLTRAQMHRLMDAIFEEKLFKVRICAAYRADPIHIDDPLPMKYYDFPSRVLQTHTPNPHMDRYQCLGQLEGRATALLESKDWFGLLEFLTAITKGLNFSDQVVTHTFVDQLYVTDAKCIQTADKQCLTPLEAYRLVEALDKEKQEATNEQTD